MEQHQSYPNSPRKGEKPVQPADSLSCSRMLVGHRCPLLKTGKSGSSLPPVSDIEIRSTPCLFCRQDGALVKFDNGALKRGVLIPRPWLPYFGQYHFRADD